MRMRFHLEKLRRGAKSQESKLFEKMVKRMGKNRNIKNVQKHEDELRDKLISYVHKIINYNSEIEQEESNQLNQQISPEIKSFLEQNETPFGTGGKDRMQTFLKTSFGTAGKGDNAKNEGFYLYQMDICVCYATKGQCKSFREYMGIDSVQDMKGYLTPSFRAELERQSKGEVKWEYIIPDYTDWTWDVLYQELKEKKKSAQLNRTTNGYIDPYKVKFLRYCFIKKYHNKLLSQLSVKVGIKNKDLFSNISTIHNQLREHIIICRENSNITTPEHLAVYLTVYDPFKEQEHINLLFDDDFPFCQNDLFGGNGTDLYSMDLFIHFITEGKFNSVLDYLNLTPKSLKKLLTYHYKCATWPLVNRSYLNWDKNPYGIPKEIDPIPKGEWSRKITLFITLFNRYDLYFIISTLLSTKSFLGVIFLSTFFGIGYYFIFIPPTKNVSFSTNKIKIQLDTIEDNEDTSLNEPFKEIVFEDISPSQVMKSPDCVRSVGHSIFYHTYKTHFQLSEQQFYRDSVGDMFLRFLMKKERHSKAILLDSIYFYPLELPHDKVLSKLHWDSLELNHHMGYASPKERLRVKGYIESAKKAGQAVNVTAPFLSDLSEPRDLLTKSIIFSSKTQIHNLIKTEKRSVTFLEQSKIFGVGAYLDNTMHHEINVMKLNISEFHICKGDYLLFFNVFVFTENNNPQEKIVCLSIRVI